jgi:hypothetical protein
MKISRKFKLFILVFVILLLVSGVVWLQQSQKSQAIAGNKTHASAVNDTGKKKVHFSVPSGNYPGGKVKVAISGNVGKGTIHYTLDGSSPTESSKVYTQPLLIKKNTVMKAAVIVNGKVKSTISATYLVEKAKLPAFSIITDPDNLWSKDKGIYVPGLHPQGKYPYKGANYWQDWGIPVDFDYIKNGKLAYKATAELKIFGGETRTLPQRSFAVSAKKKYGTKTFKYSFFPENGLSEYDSFVLRNGGQDFNKTHILDGMVSTLAQGLNIDTQAYRPVVVYLNGDYWGIYDLREKINTSFLADHHQGVDKKDIDLLEANAIVKDGSNSDYLNLINFIKTHNLSDQNNYLEAVKQIDTSSLIDYIVTELYIGNSDWPSHNYRYWKAKGDFSKWRWIIYDSDLSFGDYKEDTVKRFVDYKGKGDDSLYISYLFRELMKNQQFRSEFKNRADYLLTHTFQSDQVIQTIDNIRKQVEPEMPTHLKKWGGTMKDWENNVNQLKEFAQNRPQYLKEYLNNLYNTFQ